jgi:hypothetical protein
MAQSYIEDLMHKA